MVDASRLYRLGKYIGYGRYLIIDVPDGHTEAVILRNIHRPQPIEGDLIVLEIGSNIQGNHVSEFCRPYKATPLQIFLYRRKIQHERQEYQHSDGAYNGHK